MQKYTITSLATFIGRQYKPCAFLECDFKTLNNSHMFCYFGCFIHM